MLALAPRADRRIVAALIVVSLPQSSTMREYADDGQLVDDLRAGDDDAFGWLLDRYDSPLRRLARSFVATRTAADEVVQDTWLAVIEGIDRFEGRSSVKTWIYRILMNKARTRGVRDRRSVPFSSLVNDEVGPVFAADRFLPADDPVWPGHWASPPPSWETIPGRRLEAAETLDEVRAAIATLPLKYREVILLRDVEGMSAADVCGMLDLTPGNERVLLHRARGRVRAHLEQHFTGVTT